MSTGKDKANFRSFFFLSMAGTQMDPDLPRRVLIPEDPDALVSEEGLKGVDMLTHELSLRDELPPNSFGTSTLNITEPFVAGSYQTISQTYTVGDMAVEPGGGCLIGRHFQSYRFPSGTNFQTRDPRSEGYVTINSSEASARFTAETIPWRGLYGIAEVGTPPVFFRLFGTRLGSGKTVTITYGDTTGGSKGLRIQDYSNDAVPLPIYIDFKGDGNFIVLPLQAYEVSGKEVHAVPMALPRH